MGLILYPKWGGEDIDGSKSNPKVKETLQDQEEELPPPLYWMMIPPTNVPAVPGKLPTGN